MITSTIPLVVHKTNSDMPVYESNETKIIETRSYDTNGMDIANLLLNYLHEKIKDSFTTKNFSLEKKKDEQ